MYAGVVAKIEDARHNPNAPEVWKKVREGGCPIAHSDRYGGMWVPLTHDTVHEIAYDTDNFTSRAVIVSHTRPGDLALPAPIGSIHDAVHHGAKLGYDLAG